MNTSSVPTYKLYGEHKIWPSPEMVHCEPLAERNSLHDWNIEPHQHDGLFQIFYLKTGNLIAHLDEQEIVMGASEILLVPQNYIHGFHVGRGAVGYVLTLAYPFVLKVSQEISRGIVALSYPFHYVLSRDSDSIQLSTIFEALVQEYQGTAVHRYALIETLSATIILLVSRKVEAQRVYEILNTKDNSHYTKFINLIEQWHDKHYPLSRYAKEIGITASHLNLLCRRIAKNSPLELIHERLLLAAKRKLIYTSMTISELSYSIGFSEPAYFTRFFRRQTGETPKEFRKRAIQLSGFAPVLSDTASH